MMLFAWGYLAGAATLLLFLLYAAWSLRERERRPRPILPFTDRARERDIGFVAAVEALACRIENAADRTPMVPPDLQWWIADCVALAVQVHADDQA